MGSPEDSNSNGIVVRGSEEILERDGKVKVEGIHTTKEDTFS